MAKAAHGCTAQNPALRRINRFASGAPRMRFSQLNSISYATLRSGEARRDLVAAIRTAPPEPVADRPSFDRQRPAPMKIRRHTRSERLQTGGLSSRISFSSPIRQRCRPLCPANAPSADTLTRNECQSARTSETSGRHGSSILRAPPARHRSPTPFGKHFVVAARLDVTPAHDICGVGVIANASHGV